MLKVISLFMALIPSIVMAELLYPYLASARRAVTIKSQYIKVQEGDTENTVINILPDPDEALDLYESKIYNPKIIGKTFWYIIQRKVKSGSAKERDEKLVRISFNLQGKVIEVVHWGF